MPRNRLIRFTVPTYWLLMTYVSWTIYSWEDKDGSVDSYRIEGCLCPISNSERAQGLQLTIWSRKMLELQKNGVLRLQRSGLLLIFSFPSTPAQFSICKKTFRPGLPWPSSSRNEQNEISLTFMYSSWGRVSWGRWRKPNEQRLFNMILFLFKNSLIHTEENREITTRRDRHKKQQKVYWGIDGEWERVCVHVLEPGNAFNALSAQCLLMRLTTFSP